MLETYFLYVSVWGGTCQDVRHLEVDLGSSGLEYLPGDSLAMWPQTPSSAVDEFLARCRLQGDARVIVGDPSGVPVSNEISTRPCVDGP